MNDLLLIRHAEPRASDRLRLGIGGINEARKKARQLKAQGYSFDEMGTSQSLRAQDTARAMGAKVLIEYPLLNEVDPGIERYLFANMLVGKSLSKEVYEILLAAGDAILDELLPEIPKHIDGCATHNSTIVAVQIAQFKRDRQEIKNTKRPSLVIPHLGHTALKR